MIEKITDIHLQRIAYIYIRQSTQMQVVNNTESRRRQYGLEQRAKELGWEQIEIIDEDMGCSGSGSVERKGFEKLMASVGMGKAGAVLSLEASRLARNNRDWHQLVDICTMVNTLIIDQDGVYDPCILNDRLLLGLKGTMSEFELNLFRQRSYEALLQKAKRGELFTNIPIGYIISNGNRCEQDPDERVRSHIKLLFDKFAEIKSARQVLLWFRHEGIQMPKVKYTSQEREIHWQTPTYNAIRNILTNPIYTGAYVFGKSKVETYIEDGRARKRYGKRVEQNQWHTLIKDHHQGYISWNTYERNIAQLNENANMHGLMKVKGAPREGRSLLAGLLRCGRCGRKLLVSYVGNGGMLTRYYCKRSDLSCISISGLRVDKAIEDIILEVIQPVTIEAAIHAAEHIDDDYKEKRTSFELALQQAEYEAQRAHRQYNAVDPENRLVANELERRWNTALLKVNECKSAVDDLLLTENHKENLSINDLSHIVSDLPVIWRSEKTDVRTKKMIVRTLIKEIIVDTDTDPAIIRLTVHWQGNDHTIVCVKKPKNGEHQYITDEETVEIVRNLSRIMTDSAIALTLNRLGRRTAHANTWTQSRVATLRYTHNIPAHNKNNDTEVVTMDEASKILGISAMSVHRLLNQGVINGVQCVSNAPWIILKESLQTLQVQKAAEDIRLKIKGSLPEDPNQETLKLN